MRNGASWHPLPTAPGSVLCLVSSGKANRSSPPSPKTRGRGEKMLARSARRKFFPAHLKRTHSGSPIKLDPAPPRSPRIVMLSPKPHHPCLHTLALWNTLPIVFFCVHTGMITLVFNTIDKWVLQGCLKLPRV